MAVHPSTVIIIDSFSHRGIYANNISDVVWNVRNSFEPFSCALLFPPSPLISTVSLYIFVNFPPNPQKKRKKASKHFHNK